VPTIETAEDPATAERQLYDLLYRMEGTTVTLTLRHRAPVHGVLGSVTWRDFRGVSVSDALVPYRDIESVRFR
jgi:hypothetical protein